MLKRIFSLTAFLFMAIAPVYASVSAAPFYLEIDANETRGDYITATINLKGDEQKLTRLKVNAGYFTISPTGEYIIKNEYTGDEHDLSKKIKFVPSEFNVLAGKSQKLRLNIMGVKKLPDGESRAMLFVENVDDKTVNLAKSEGFSAQIIVKTRIGIPIFVDKGKYTKKAELESLKVIEDKDELYTEMKINSTGNSRVKYWGKAQIIKDKELIAEYDLQSRSAGDNNYLIAKDKIDTKDVKENGKYTLRVVLSYENEHKKRINMVKETELDIHNIKSETL